MSHPAASVSVTWLPSVDLDLGTEWSDAAPSRVAMTPDVLNLRAALLLLCPFPHGSEARLRYDNKVCNQ